MSSVKPSIRMQIRDLRGQYLKFSHWLGSFNELFGQYAEITDILYEMHKDEVNKIIEERIKTKEEKK